MRDRSYLTPMGQVFVGGVVLIACIAFPALFVIVLMVIGGRFLRDLARRSASGAALAVVLLVAVGLGLGYLLRASGLGAVVIGATLGGGVWLVATHVRAKSKAGVGPHRHQLISRSKDSTSFAGSSQPHRPGQR